MTVKDFKMFVWNKDVLTDCGDGIIVVMARDIHEATQLLASKDPYLFKEILGKEFAVYDGPSFVSLRGSA